MGFGRFLVLLALAVLLARPVFGAPCQGTMSHGQHEEPLAGERPPHATVTITYQISSDFTQLRVSYESAINPEDSLEWRQHQDVDHDGAVSDREATWAKDEESGHLAPGSSELSALRDVRIRDFRVDGALPTNRSTDAVFYTGGTGEVASPSPVVRHELAHARLHPSPGSLHGVYFGTLLNQFDPSTLVVATPGWHATGFPRDVDVCVTSGVVSFDLPYGGFTGNHTASLVFRPGPSAGAPAPSPVWLLLAVSAGAMAYRGVQRLRR